jgi:DNA repair protein RadA/Sms
MGKCPECKSWNSLVEVTQNAAPKRAGLGKATTRPVALGDIPRTGSGELRHLTQIAEFDNVLGGGLVAGSLVLIGGDPGVGKSTLLLMALDRYVRRGLKALYVTGEESLQQVRMRADRLGIDSSLMLLSSTSYEHIEASVRELNPSILVLDSVQTVAVGELESIAGSVSQVREVAHRAMSLAKNDGVATLLVGHITKSGNLAGPKVLEHFVDAVLHFEGDGSSSLRMLRTIKNRFGPSGELGMFEMLGSGLQEVPDASARLLRERPEETAGTAVVASIEGSRPLLTEVQALVGRPVAGTPGRTCVGVDRTRVSMLAAVVEKADISVYDRDIFVNVAGGIKLSEPAADLGIFAAIVSSLVERPIIKGTLIFGEIGLTGEIRSVPQPALRLKEAVRHGFERVIGPAKLRCELPETVEYRGVSNVREALAELF